MQWGQFAWAIVVCAVVVTVAGLPIALALRLRGLWLTAATAGLGVSVISGSAVLAGVLGVRWTVWLPLAIALLLSVSALLLVRASPALRPSRAVFSEWRWASLLAVMLGVGLLAARFVSSISAPAAFAQVSDNVFHLNAVRFIADTGMASPLNFGGFGDASATIDFYPTGWHAISALVVEFAGVSVPIAANAVLFAFACVIWPLGAVLLTRSLFGGNTVLLVSAGAITAGFAVFPFEPIPYIGAFPLVGGIALISIALAAVCELCGVGNPILGRGAAGLVLATTVPGIALVHPSAFVMFSVLALPAVVAAAIRVQRARPALGRLPVLLAGLVAASVLALIIFVRPPNLQENSWRTTMPQAIGELLLQSQAGPWVQLTMAVLTGVGIVVAVMTGVAGRVAVVMWVLAGAVYVAAVGDDEFLRIVLAGPWYGDATRVAAFAAAVTVPLAALGARSAWHWIIDLMPRPRAERLRWLAVPVALVVLCALLLQSPGVRQIDNATRSAFAPTDDPFLSLVAVGQDELEVLEAVGELVPSGELIAGNPWDGSSFAYAVTGRPVLVGHILAPISPVKQDFIDGFAEASTSDPACEAARDLEVKWILEFHPDKLMPRIPRYAGLDNLDDSPNVELAFRSGSSSLYKVVGCGIG